MARLFGVPADEVHRAVAALARSRAVSAGVPGLPEDWVLRRAAESRRP